MQDIFLLLRDAHYVMRGYATPIQSHALQVYHSVLATAPGCKLLDWVKSARFVAPRLLSQRASGWSPVLQVMEGHRDTVHSVACSLDGLYIVSGSDDRTVRVWDAHTGKQLVLIEGHSDWVQSVAFSPDGAHIVSGSSDQTVRVWNAQTGNELAVLEGHRETVRSVAFSPDGAHIVSGSDDKTVRVWDAQTGKELAVLEGHSGLVLSVAFSPDGAHIVSASDDETVRVWDAQTGKELAVLEGHSGWCSLWHSRPTERTSSRALMTGLCGCGMRRQAKSSPYSRVTAIRCCPWHSLSTENTSSPVSTVAAGCRGTLEVQLLPLNNLRSRS
jgi:WD40 repeat protein